MLLLGATPAPAAPFRVERARYLMGTLCHAVAVHRDSGPAGEALGRALDEVARLERVMSSWREGSELARLNAAAGAPFSCSADLFAVLDSARALAEATGGAFDPTVEPLSRAWDMRGAGRVPSEPELGRARALVGWSRLRLEPPRTARLDGPGAGLDLGGIGKGFALDRAAEVLRAAGVERALLNFGGEVLALGTAVRGYPQGDNSGKWTVSVAHPADRLRPVVRLEVRDAAVSTSAQSERGFVVRGQRYGHVLDPRTGRPVATRASVTVVAPSGTRADALSTALLVRGREEAAAWCRGHPADGVLWLEPAGDAVRAWAWNVGTATAAAGARVIWMTPASAPSAANQP